MMAFPIFAIATGVHIVVVRFPVGVSVSRLLREAERLEPCARGRRRGQAGRRRAGERRERLVGRKAWRRIEPGDRACRRVVIEREEAGAILGIEAPGPLEEIIEDRQAPRLRHVGVEGTGGRERRQIELRDEGEGRRAFDDLGALGGFAAENVAIFRLRPFPVAVRPLRFRAIFGGALGRVGIARPVPAIWRPPANRAGRRSSSPRALSRLHPRQRLFSARRPVSTPALSRGRRISRGLPKSARPSTRWAMRTCADVTCPATAPMCFSTRTRLTWASASSSIRPRRPAKLKSSSSDPPQPCARRRFLDQPLFGAFEFSLSKPSRRAVSQSTSRAGSRPRSV